VGGRYADLAAGLQRSFAYGLTDAAVVLHAWQRWGYDYRLPDIFPPNPALGTSEEFGSVAKACKQAGVLFAPHDNYIDYYPDAEGFSYAHIAFDPGGTPVKAGSTRAQGQPTAGGPRTRRPLRRIVERIARSSRPTAYFIDVWSSTLAVRRVVAGGGVENRVQVATRGVRRSRDPRAAGR